MKKGTFGKTILELFKDNAKINFVQKPFYTTEQGRCLYGRFGLIAFWSRDDHNVYINKEYPGKSTLQLMRELLPAENAIWLTQHEMITTLVALSPSGDGDVNSYSEGGGACPLRDL